MKALDEFKSLLLSSFTLSKQWVDWFVNNAVNPDDLFIDYDAEGKAVSCLMLQPYDFAYQGHTLKAGYISCVATLPQARSKGLASGLMSRAVAEAARRGYDLCVLIPAAPSLHFFYRRFAFSSCFYDDVCHYTSIHPFSGGTGSLVEPSAALLRRLEEHFGCGILHSAADYANILHDLKLDGANAVIAAADDAGEAILLADCTGEVIKVKSLIYSSEGASLTALAELRRRVGEKAIDVWGPPLTGDKAFLRPIGMGRIVSAEAVLGTLAAKHHDLKRIIRLHDRLVEENNGTFIVAGGECKRGDDSLKPDIDVSIETLTSLIFSSEATGDIFGLPSRRPYMALMLD